MTGARRDGLYLLLLGSIVFALLGSALESASPVAMVDFKVVYYSARCLLQHGDPYRQNDLLRVYQEQAGGQPSDNPKIQQIVTQYIYLPTAFPFTIPFALLGFGLAHVLWMIITAAGFIFASYLTWELGAKFAPTLSGALLCCFLAGSELLLISGNAAGIVVSFCVVAVWCFLTNRLVAVGVVCLALALAIKPQDAGLIWIYFLLAGGVHLRRALATLAVAAAIGLPAVAWAWHVSPHWMAEMQGNIAALSAHGGISDPGPSSSGSHGLSAITDLQGALSSFRDDPRFYNPVSDLLCGALFLVWAFKAVRSRWSVSSAWLALATIAALSLLPIYHRQYDAKLLLLVVPACAMLWKEGRRWRWPALLVSAMGILLLTDLPWAILIQVINSFPLPNKGWGGQLILAMQVVPIPLVLLANAVFYLWAYLRFDAGEERLPHESAL